MMKYLYSQNEWLFLFFKILFSMFFKILKIFQLFGFMMKKMKIL